MSAAQHVLFPVVTRSAHEVWYCKEYWNGDSKDGVYVNGDGYHFYKIEGNGNIIDAFEFYESDDGEERSLHLPDLIGINWYAFFGYTENDSELLEPVPEHAFGHVKRTSHKS